MSKATKRHMALVAVQPCILCGEYGVELHHIREGQGMAQRAGDWLVIPLCPSCHRGPNGVHGDKAMLLVRKWTELDALAATIEAVYGG